MYKRQVFKGDTEKINSDDEHTEIVRESERIMWVGGSDGVEISVCKLGSEYEEIYVIMKFYNESKSLKCCKSGILGNDF